MRLRVVVRRWNRHPFPDPGLNHFPQTRRFLAAASPCRAPCRDLRGFHFFVSSGRHWRTSGSSCCAEDGSAASSHRDCLRQIRCPAIGLRPPAPCFLGPTSTRAVVLLLFLLPQT